MKIYNCQFDDIRDAFVTSKQGYTGSFLDLVSVELYLQGRFLNSQWSGLDGYDYVNLFGEAVEELNGHDRFFI